jgi:glycosyltransferase involved in cell wall biosynthesis
LVAVYNAEKTLARCLDSLLCQTYTHLEILCVDDCSTDGSFALLQQYAGKDSRVKMFRQQRNQGQAVGRNVALRAATGHLTTFLDSDDRLAPDAIALAVDTFRRHPQAGCVLFDAQLVRVSGKVEPYPMPFFESMPGYEAFLKSLTWQVHGLYVARTDLYKRFPYDETCHSYSDDNTTKLHYFHSQEVCCCKGRYYYYDNQASVSHAPSIHRFDHMRANESMKRQLIALGVGEDVLTLYEELRWRVVVDSYFFYFCNYSRLSPQSRRYALDEMRRVRATIETWRLPARLKWKFGYCPMPSWWLFRLQEWLYFSLRRLKGGL